MKLAFSTLLLIFILFPGIFFRLGYLKRDGLRAVAETKMYIEILFVVFISLTLHFFSWYVSQNIFSYNFHVDLFYTFILGENIPNLDDKENIIKSFVVYNFALSAALFFTGWGIRKLLEKLESIKVITEKYDYLDYTGSWERIFSFRREKKREIHLTEVDLLVKINDRAIIYTGTLVEYFLTSNNGFIDKLVLDNVVRIDFDDYNKIVKKSNKKVTPVKKEEFIKDLAGDFMKFKEKSIVIPSNHFVIYGSTILNVGIRYVEVLKPPVSVSKDNPSTK